MGLRRFSWEQEDGDLRLADLEALWLNLCEEQLVSTVFHDAHVRNLKDFIYFVSSPNLWFYGVEEQGKFIGFGFLNDFSSSRNTAYIHFCSFKEGRKQNCYALQQAAKDLFTLLWQETSLITLLAVLPKPYRAARHFAESLEFKAMHELPKALALHRAKGRKFVDACVYKLDIEKYYGKEV